jgi:hypothetical protein
MRICKPVAMVDSPGKYHAELVKVANNRLDMPVVENILTLITQLVATRS